MPGPGGAVQAHTLPSAQDCLQGIQSFLRVHRNIVSTLIGLGLAFTVALTAPAAPTPRVLGTRRDRPAQGAGRSRPGGDRASLTPFPGGW